MAEKGPKKFSRFMRHFQSTIKYITIQCIKKQLLNKNKKNSRSVKYRTKLAFEVDGKAYEGEETYNQKVYVGDKVKVEVYRTSKVIY